ncbi:MAG: TatD family hydrolase [Pseudomonadota bacterium]
MIIDSHCHLDHAEFAADREAVIARARAAGVTHMITIGADLASSQRALEIAREHDGIFATVGVHPHDAREAPGDYLQRLTELATDACVVAIGEIGLDYHYDLSPRKTQRARFAEQLNLARERNLPVVIHMREAEDDCLGILREVGLGPRGGVMHCFSSTVAYARLMLELDLSLSIPGIVTYKKPGELVDLVRSLPMDCLMIETDAPYLAPVPYRGQRNEPAFVAQTAAFIARATGHQLQDVHRTTARTAIRRLGLPIDDEGLRPRIAYAIRGNLYLNITNACTLACTFCPKQRERYVVQGHALKLDRAPTVGEIKASCGDLASYAEVVFVGLGESTLRLEVVKELAAWLKTQGKRVRLDTDGLANRIYQRNVAAELKGLVDAVSVSLNAADAETYARLCPSKLGESAFGAVQEFITTARDAGLEVTASVVGLPEFDAAYLERCRALAEDTLHVRFRVRTHDNVG